MPKDYYDILGVNKSASQEDIKKAFRGLAHQHHPDKSGGNADKFKEINEAYQTIGDAEKRKQYDQFGSAFAGGQGPSGFSYQDFARAQGANPFGGGFSQGNVHFDFGDAGDLGEMFGSFFGGAQGGRGRKRERGEDIEVALNVDFAEAVFGADKTIELNKQILCDRCGGNGAEPGSKISTCKTCNGSGSVSRVQQTILGAFQTQSVCSHCNGEGKTFEKKCTQCHGAGIVHGSERIKVKIPAGIENGQAIKFSGKGEPAPKGTAGDLYLTIRVKSHKNLERRNNDIFSCRHISLKQAILGDKIEVETVDGPVKLNIPEGTQSRVQFRLKDKGVPRLQSRGRGDHLVEIIVDIPKNVSRKMKQILEES